ncbi:hypothetical protein NXW84_10615 [Bacteroides fragilis]|nr:hypothetical protein NXW84_10615 [Bacteroides fragilis]
MDDLKWNKNEIDALIFVSQTPDYILPATSCVLQGKMGFKKECFSLDISLGCSGMGVWSFYIIEFNGMEEI